jgi:N-acetylmuramic acid 6-phosphate etherase
MNPDFSNISTEQRNARTMEIDRLAIPEIVELIHREDQNVALAVQAENLAITKAVQLLVERMKRGGRMILAGAGTSGRMGVLEAAECPPTFDTPPGLVEAIMAGGPACVWASREGAEDDAADGARQVKKRKIGNLDTLIGIAASGVTPFVHGALGAAKRAGAGRILVTCNREGVDAAAADVIIAPFVGPEVITGSTRLKAGTATKLVLNTLTVATMVKLGKVYENLMVDLQPKSAKLVARSKRIIMTLAGVDEKAAAKALKAAGNRAKVAIVMLKKSLTRREADALLAKHEGLLRAALEA